MPCEVTPIPFVEQQLPYNPKFVREIPEGQGNGEGSMRGMGGPGSVYGPGPVAAAASVLIAPSPGGVAGPHNAIPALPDAGYTAPGIRATTLGLELGAPGPGSARSSLGDGHGPHAYGAMRPGYGGASYTQDAFGPGQGQGSVYGHGVGGQHPGYGGGNNYAQSQGYAPSSYGQQQQGGYGLAPPPPMTTISSASWGHTNTNTFPAPRRASNQALVPPVAESTIAPRGVSHRSSHAIDPRHHPDEQPHKHHSRREHGHAPSVVDDWETGSDASYYARARPKASRTRSGSTLSDITPDTGNRPGLGHHHSHSHSHHVSAHNTPKGSPLRGQSPASPSPFARDAGLARSPLSPGGRSHLDQRHGRKISGLGGGEIAPASFRAHNSPYKAVTPLPDAPDHLGRDRDGSERRHRHHSASFEEKRGLHPGSMVGYNSDDEGRYSSKGRGRGRDKTPHEDAGGYDDTPSHGRHASSSRRSHKHRAEAYPDDQYNQEARVQRDDGRSQHGEQDYHRTPTHTREKHHHRPRSHSHVPPPLPYRGSSPAPPATLQVPHHRDREHLMPDMGALSLSSRDRDRGEEPRRRAHSMQYNQHQQTPGMGQGQMMPSPGSMAGFGAGGGGYGPGGGGGSYMQAPPSVMGMGEAFDDGGSVAGSAMTFMDGAMGGRTSQYGLPKYPHQAKPDPRRFMVQRGKADVYLD